MSTILVQLLLTTNMLFFAASPLEGSVVDYVDVVEVNHYYDNNGRHVFDQAIYYNWSNVSNRFDVVAWRLIKNTDIIPLKNWKNDLYVSNFKDGEVDRTIRAKEVRTTYTNYDPEMLEREFLEREQRVGLSPRRTKSWIK